MPEGVTLELLDAVTKEMGADADPPKGLIMHTHYMEAGNVQILDVWEAEADYHEFAKSRLGPAIAKVAQANGATEPPARAAENWTDAHRVVRGR